VGAILKPSLYQGLLKNGHLPLRGGGMRRHHFHTRRVIRVVRDDGKGRFQLESPLLTGRVIELGRPGRQLELGRVKWPEISRDGVLWRKKRKVKPRDHSNSFWTIGGDVHGDSEGHYCLLVGGGFPIEAAGSHLQNGEVGNGLRSWGQTKYRGIERKFLF